MRTRIAMVLGFMLVTSYAYAEEKAAAGAKPKAAAKKMSDAEIIKLAQSSGPPDVSKDATIMTMEADGKMRQLKEGKNGWMCMVAGQDSMCLDKEWQSWAQAWVGHTDPQVKGVGIAYMLHGDEGASNTDPFATAPTPDNAWVVSPPHIMVLSPDTKLIDSLPTDPYGGGPWVMWKGTKYAHIMVPVSPVKKPKAAAAKPADAKPAAK